MDKKRILFIGVGFHEYDTYIIEHLKEKYDVWYFCSSEYILKHPHIYSLSLKFPFFFKDFNNQLISNKIEETKMCDFDIIFAIKGSNLSDEHLMTLKKHHPRAALKLYLWDEWMVMKNRDVLEKHFDKIFSFDSEDCKKYGFILRPLFYLEKYQAGSKNVDVSFIGGEHSGRLEAIINMKAACLENGLSYCFIVSTRLTTMFKIMMVSIKKFLKNYGIMKFEGVSYSEFLRITRESKTVLDIHYKNQSGLTMRTIEALAAGTKVITTNHHIKEYKNIPNSMYYVWDMRVNQALIDFIKAPVSDFEIDNSFSVDVFFEDILK